MNSYPEVAPLPVQPQPSEASRYGFRAACGAMVLAVSLSPSFVSQPAAAAELQAAAGNDKPEVTFAFDGDSISDDGINGRGGKYYDNIVGSPRRVWWGRVADQLDGKVISASGQGNSGWLMRGNPSPSRHNSNRTMCKGTNFVKRVKQPGVKHAFKVADFAVVPLGFNDTGVCNENGKKRPSSIEDVSQAVDTGMDAMLKLRTAAGKAPESVYVLTPCATEAKTGRRKKVIAVVRESALAHGFIWVDMDGVLNRRNTLGDGIHPNYNQGTADLAKAFLRRSDIIKEVRALRNSRNLISQQ